MTFEDGRLSIVIGKKTLSMIHLPGHSIDGTGVLIEEDRVLFAGDVFMPLPYLVDGNYDQMVASLKFISKMGLENVVQGHGDVVLRGEIEGAVKDHLSYLSHIRRIVRQSHRRKYPADMLTNVGVESCGKGRVLIGGLAEDLHQRNLVALYKEIYGEIPAASEVYYEEY
jgi:glyoxylase-like metal-dependent hydrolase (beta-lactamase superfamily II)